VDDNEDAASLLGDVISSLGHHVRIANDGPMALDIAPTFVPDLALLDIGSPAMDGYQVATRRRAIEILRGVRLVAVTGYGQPSDRSRSEAHGLEQVGVEAIDLETLTSLLSTLFDPQAIGKT
jgi:CheY-like chemotaxis protein